MSNTHCECETNEKNYCCVCEIVSACEECMPVRNVIYEEIEIAGACCKRCLDTLGIVESAGLDP